MQDQIANADSRQRTLAILGICLLVIFAFSLMLGRYPELGIITPERLQQDGLAYKLVVNLRLPRLITAMLLGASLSAAGVVFQMLFGNPLVEPGFLGVTQGASFGTAFCIIFLGNSALFIQVFSTFFALIGVAGSFLLARRAHFGGWVLRLILAGIVVSALFSSGVGLLKYIADPLSQLPEINFWLLGGLWSITWARLTSILPVVLAGLIVMILMRWRLNLLSLNDEISFSLGAAPGRERLLLVFAATMATAAVISVSGMVMWVGLIIPHISRRIFGADTRFSLPGAILLGGAFGMVCDDLARTILPGEIPLGVLTALIGASAFMILMLGQRMKVPK